MGKFCQFAYMDDLAVGAICARAGKFSRMAKPIGQIFLDFLFRLLSFYSYFSVKNFHSWILQLFLCRRMLILVLFFVKWP